MLQPDFTGKDMTATAPTFTAAQIAAALGMKPSQWVKAPQKACIPQSSIIIPQIIVLRNMGKI
jgi:hypothetical protein